ncbi:MAG: hypothetical protein C0609_02450 [Deltaproteobacteria bacterium]|nr:MAG: hypothetical protein C0609_02450 [Deltaproteobacteria bacterium]
MLERSKYIEIFLDEGRDILSSLEKELLALERNPASLEAISTAIRLAHTLKGSSRMVGLVGVSNAAHGIENILEVLGSSAEDVSGDDFSLIFDVLDRISVLFESISGGEVSDLDIDFQNLEPWGLRKEEKSSEKPLEPIQKTRKKTPKRELKPLLSLELSGTDSITSQRLGDALRVRLGKLDLLMEELENATVVSRNLADHLASIGPAPLGVGGNLSAGALRVESERLEALISSARNAVVEMRLLPVSSLFNQYPRMVRDIAEELGKEVELKVEGGDLELDKHLMEDVYGSLTHLVRNALDHGVEGPDERTSRGKEKRGVITLRAYQRPGAVVVEVEDDGHGIDSDKLRSVAIKRGFLQPAEAEQMDDEALAYLLLKPGFTTRREADQLSGRGVGLDVVKNMIDSIHGTMTIKSERGQFTRFSLFLPKSYSGLKGVKVTSGGVPVVIPTLFVEKCFRITAEEFQRRDGSIPYMGERLHLVSLALILGKKVEDVFNGLEVLVLRFRERRMALAVEKIEGDGEFLLKGTGRHLEEAGASLLGITITREGIPAPVFDVRYLAERWAGLEFSCRMPLPRVKRKLRVLVVDDALTSLHVVSSFVGAMGHSVFQAHDGAEAWNMLEDYPVDLVVTDMEMPEIDGIELTRRIRRSEWLKKTPVIMISVKSQETVIGRAFEAGVNAFVPKERLSGAYLEKTIKNILPDI